MYGDRDGGGRDRDFFQKLAHEIVGAGKPYAHTASQQARHSSKSLCSSLVLKSGNAGRISVLS